MVIYLDIETIPPPIDLAPFVSKAALQGWPVEKYASLSPVLARTICVGIGTSEGEWAIVGEEASILDEVADALEGAAKLVTWNGRDFDVPTLSNAFLRNGRPVPAILRRCVGKPWEVPHYDLTDLVAWGGRPKRPSLQEACLGMGLPDPKANGDGSAVWLLWQAGKRDEVAAYCRSDVKALKLLAAKLQWVG